ncbi:NUDIX domain-containing protein [bacterium]|nr:NUDIX domain-containing protein [bacterium]
MDDPRPFSLSVKSLVFDADRRCLILKRSDRNRNYPGKWELPGGKLSPGETFAEALIREVREEAGLHIEIDRLAGAVESELPEWRIVHLFMEARVVRGDIRLSPEHTEYGWVAVDDLPLKDMPEHFVRFVRAYRRKEERHEDTTGTG